MIRTRYRVCENTNLWAYSGYGWTIVDDDDDGWICGRFMTEQDAMHHAKILNDRAEGN